MTANGVLSDQSGANGQGDAEQTSGSQASAQNSNTPAWLRADEKSTPIWLRTLYASLPVTAVYVLHGGVHDLHPIQVDGQLRPDTTVNAIWQVLKACGFQALLTFEPLNGLTINRCAENWDSNRVCKALEAETDNHMVRNLLMTPTERAVQAREDPSAAEVSFVGMDAIAEAVAQLTEPAMALVIDYTSQIRSENQTDDPALAQLMLASLALADSHILFNGRPIRFPRPGQDGRMRHPVIWLVDKPDDLPVWLTHGDGIRQIPITSPNIDTRQTIAGLLVRDQVPDEAVDEVARRFADATEGFSTRGMFESVQLARGTSSVAENIEGAVRTYREGLSENPWQSTHLREQLADGEAILGRRVLGQDEAVEKVLDILKRSALGLTGAHQKKPSNMPRGVLYFAGPTGVGKTEMAKAIAELVFADEQALLRFDMSEFQENHAKIRLIGAPPSYAGYGAGGELTNAIQQRPHSIVLFDEMDKAGKEVYDLFLQILSDGRLTDGSGRTALFSEALIIFTSNQGVAAAGDLLHLDMADPEQADEYERTIKGAVEDHFRVGLGRPELLGRLGDNIVVFRPMQGQVALDLASQFIDTILANVRIRIGNHVTLTEEVRAALVGEVTGPDDLANGARGITTALESRLTNPLGRELFALPPDSAARITGIGLDEDGQPTLDIVTT
jgi:hypothetical protein